MRCIFNQNTDSYFNIASEEYLLKNSDENIFMVYRNYDAVIIGKHQNAYAEINLPFIKENSISVVRRISGGGTVFHDLGNINFAFIQNGKKQELVNFRKFTDPIIQLLKQYSVEAKFEGKNDLRVGGKKISGNAEHIFKSRVLHHGTLLFDSNLEKLISSIHPGKGEYKDKAVQSIRSKVCNLRPLLNQDMMAEEFMKEIYSGIFSSDAANSQSTFSKDEIVGIEKLKNEKFQSENWTYGYSPNYEYFNEFELQGLSLVVYFKVVKGKIESSRIKNKTGIISEPVFEALYHNLEAFILAYPNGVQLYDITLPAEEYSNCFF